MDDQLGEQDERVEIDDRLRPHDTGIDGCVERRPLIGVDDLLSYVIGNDEFVTGDATEQLEPRHVHHVDEHVRVRDHADDTSGHDSGIPASSTRRSTSFDDKPTIVTSSRSLARRSDPGTELLLSDRHRRPAIPLQR
jgi:hypothetical protein